MNISRLLTLLTSVLGLISCFLPWVNKISLDSSGFSRSYSGLDQGDGFPAMILCLIAVTVAITGKRSKQLNKLKKWTVAISGLLIIASCAWSLSYMKETNAFNASIDLSLISMPAIGLWAGCIIGCLLFLLPLVIKGREVIKEEKSDQ